MADKTQSREERRKQQQHSKNKGKKKSKGLVKKTFLTLVVLGIVGMLAGVATFAFMVKDAPKLDEKLLKDPISSEVFDMDKETITEIGSVKRDYVDYEDIPKMVENAFIAVEDSRFYQHNGIDVIRLGGAVIANITDGFGSEGASTITQQVVKNSFLSHEKTISRKAQEAWLSFQLERKYTKQEIFEMYVNKIWMAAGGHGVATAAKVYYGKELDELTLAEAALLAGMPQSPANYNPFEYPEKAEKRRNIVLTLMNRHGFITKEELEEAKSVDVVSTLVKEEDRPTGDIPYDAFIGQVIKEIKKKYPDLNPFSDGLKIYTTLDRKAQDHVENLLAGNAGVQFPDNKFQAGITLLDTKTGEIRALGGGRNRKGDFGFNFATDSKRQPGSTIKPILDYGPAIEHLKWGTYHMLDDKPYKYSTGQPINNWDNKHMGPMTMRTALALSRNVPALQAMQAVGLEQSKTFANGIGIPLKEIHEAYSIGGLGGKHDKGVSSLEMAGAYSAFGNNGLYTEPYSVIEVELRDGTKLNLKPETKVAMQDYTAFMVTDMLKSVVQWGTGTRANVPGQHIAGKTGTTNYDKAVREKHNIPWGAVPDSWFVGYTPNYTAAVWTGYANPNKNYLIGTEQKISQDLFKNLIQQVSAGDTEDFTMPNSVEKVKIEKGTMPAKLASEFTPPDQVLNEYAVKGNIPTEVSEKFDKLEMPSELKAEFLEASNEISLSWQHEGGDGVQFEVYGALNDGNEQLLITTTEKSVSIPVEYVGFYSFKVVAIREEMKSDPATTTLEIADPTTEEDIGEGSEDGTETDTGSGETGSGESGSGDTGDNGSGDTGTGDDSTGDHGTTDDDGSTDDEDTDNN
ncbi:PBP1A family penicillin-binding protein [Bacillus sp. 31A1R]|uniref:PBP1A family penicillin-binding protein n=1 Tax=Robertmurraya mangrovi TaxID=3098077 RepID=A0ABU5J1H6_9BACI|nr:PBP1A family penicillin-binding protein [Bacillus sp. 31A1R]MDZ5473221.1 PBP1A family penicillin-binding protein [Bacillus sp. 31A1R]